MQTKQAIQTSANVIKITNISVGDVYKRFDESYDDRVYYGLVKNVHNDGEKTIIEAVEYQYAYSSVEVNYRVLRGEQDYILFPSTPEELNLELEKAKKESENKITEAKETIETQTKLLKEIEGLISGKTQKDLKAMDYKELTQKDYEAKKALI